VTVKDENGSVVAGVTVTVDYTGPTSGTVSGVTNTRGVAKLKSRPARNPIGTWCFTVTNLSKQDYTYDPNANVVTTRCEGE
jgi:hypothetical protein